MIVFFFFFLLIGCGGYIELMVSGFCDIVFGSIYSVYFNCIWVIKVLDKYVVNGDFIFRGEKFFGGVCEDYLVVGIIVVLIIC